MPYYIQATRIAVNLVPWDIIVAKSRVLLDKVAPDDMAAFHLDPDMCIFDPPRRTRGKRYAYCGRGMGLDKADRRRCRDLVKIWPYRRTDGRVVVLWMGLGDTRRDREDLIGCLPLFDENGNVTPSILA